MHLRSLLVLTWLFLAGVLGATPTSQSLAGKWRFALDPADAGVSEQWFARELEGGAAINLPGVLQAQGYGNDISADTPWVLTLGDAWWKLQPESLRAVFSQPGRVEVPFLSQPPKHYLGAAWYQREIVVPPEAAGRRLALFLEKPHWETTLWLDGKHIGSNNSLVAPHEYELGLAVPGRHILTIRIDNRQVVRDPRNDHHQPDAHAISDALGQTWNGIAGRIELSTTSPVWLDDVQVYPNVAKKSALVRIKIGNATAQPGSGTLTIGARSQAVQWTESGGSAQIEVALGDDAKTWDEFQPHLHRLAVILTGTKAEDLREVSFGLREISWKGKDLLLNGRVVNLRTTHFGGDFPQTGYPSTDVEEWKRIIRRCQEFGLNGMRFHSVCPPKAAFEAADELGFYLQPELGLWAPFHHDGTYTRYMEEETPRLLRAFGNHPSFVLFSPSNEPAGRYTEITPKWAAAWYKEDPRRLYAAGTGWSRAEQVTGGTQFAILVRYDGGELRNQTGWFGNDFRHALRNVEIPVLAHEIGQWCAYPDFDVINKFTGYLRPSNYRIFRHIAEQTGVAEFNREFAWASGKFQLACYKEELEANLRTPGLAGHQMLDIRDYLGQGTALIGVLDAFWDPKSYVTAEDFRRFHSQTVPLARLRQRIFTSRDTLRSEVELYHFGEKPIAGASPYWKITDKDDRVAAAGEWPQREIPRGKNIPLGEIALPLGKLPSPAAYKLRIGLAGTSVENDWNFWLYPAETEATAAPDLLVTSKWADAEARLSEGQSVLFFPDASALDPTRCPPLKTVPIFWNIQMTVRPPRNPQPRFDAMLGLLVDSAHAALAEFPTDRFCDWQWTSLIGDVRSANLTDAPRSLQPIVAAIDDWNRNWRLGVVFEARVGKGKLLVCTIPLKSDDRRPAARQLNKSLVDYAGSSAFAPRAELTLDEARALWTIAAKPSSAMPSRQHDPDLDDGTAPKRSSPETKPTTVSP